MTTENGLIVENVLPTELAKKIAPTETIESYPSAINIEREQDRTLQLPLQYHIAFRL